MEIKAYTKVGCKFCGNLIELFERAGVEYTTIVVGEKANQCPTEVFRKEYPDVIGFPFVVIDGERIGGPVSYTHLTLPTKRIV